MCDRLKAIMLYCIVSYGKEAMLLPPSISDYTIELQKELKSCGLRIWAKSDIQETKARKKSRKTDNQQLTIKNSTLIALT